jgi:hypothetical protein
MHANGHVSDKAEKALRITFESAPELLRISQGLGKPKAV